MLMLIKAIVDKDEKKPSHKPGDAVKFRKPSDGEVVSSGKDGAVVKDKDGEEHEVPHDQIEAADDKSDEAIEAAVEAFRSALLAIVQVMSDDDDKTTKKALEAGYGTDSATLEGGAALRKQSLGGGDRDKRIEALSRSLRALLNLHKPKPKKSN